MAATPAGSAITHWESLCIHGFLFSLEVSYLSLTLSPFRLCVLQRVHLKVNEVIVQCIGLSLFELLQMHRTIC